MTARQATLGALRRDLRNEADPDGAVNFFGHTRHINNWDLVDASAEHIVGPHVGLDGVEVLEGLATSRDLWERRIAMLATFHGIKRNEFAPALRIAAPYAIEHFPERQGQRNLAGIA